MLRKFFLALVILLAFKSYAQQSEKINLVISSSTKPMTNFIGFGAEWDSRAYDENGITDDDFEIIGSRIKWMEVPIVRIMMLTKWCYSESLGSNWETNEMKSLYRHLEFCQKYNINVMLTDWGIEVDWLAVDGIEKMDNPKYAEVIGIYLDYLINQKGFSCIKYFGLVNEPNYEVGDFERWRQGAENLFQVFKDKGLDKVVKFVGPGQSNNNQWFFDTVDEARYIFDVYDVHMYAWKDRTAKGGVQMDLTELWNYAKAIDPKVNDKQFFVTEAGMRDGQSAAISTQIDDFYYGIFMVDFAIQAVHSGASAVLAWMMDDNSHPNFEWGLWKSKKERLEYRPWFYTWSLLTKSFPAGSNIYKIRSRSINIRALGAKSNFKGKSNWSFVVVNVGNEKANVLLKVDNGEESNFSKFLYKEGELLSDKNGLPVLVNRLSINLKDGFEFEIPPRSVIFLTNQIN